MPVSLRLRAAGIALAAVTFGVGLPLTHPASTQAQQEVGEARALFMAGRSAFNEGRYEAALNYFTQSYELSGKSLLLFNIAQCHDRLRNDAKAIETFEAYLAAMPDAENRNEVESRLAILRKATAAEGSAAPTIDAPPAPEPAAVAAPEPQTQPAIPPADQPPEEPVRPAADPPTMSDAGAASEATTGSLPIGPIALVGAGGVATITGIVLMVVGSSTASSLQDELNQSEDPTLTQAYVQTELDSANAAFVPGTVIMSVGLAAVAGGALWWVLGSDEDTSTASMRVFPLAGGLAMDGRF